MLVKIQSAQVVNIQAAPTLSGNAGGDATRRMLASRGIIAHQRRGSAQMRSRCDAELGGESLQRSLHCIPQCSPHPLIRQQVLQEHHAGVNQRLCDGRGDRTAVHNQRFSRLARGCLATHRRSFTFDSLGEPATYVCVVGPASIPGKHRLCFSEALFAGQFSATCDQLLRCFNYRAHFFLGPTNARLLLCCHDISNAKFLTSSTIIVSRLKSNQRNHRKIAYSFDRGEPLGAYPRSERGHQPHVPVAD